MHKKGMNILADWMWHLVLLMLIIGVFFAVISKVQNNSILNLKVEVNDYAMTRDAILTSPYTISYSYVARSPDISIGINPLNCEIQADYVSSSLSPEYVSCAKNNFVKLNENTGKGEVNISS